MQMMKRDLGNQEKKKQARRDMKIFSIDFGTKASFCEPVVSVTRSCEMI